LSTNEVLMRLSSWIVIVIVAVFVSSCHTATEPQRVLPGTVVGHVVIDDTMGFMSSAFSASYSGIVVRIEGSSFLTTTDSLGFWKIENIPAGTYNISATKNGFGLDRMCGVVISGPGITDLRIVRSFRLNERVHWTPTLYRDSGSNSLAFFAGIWGLGVDYVVDRRSDVRAEDSHSYIVDPATFCEDECSVNENDLFNAGFERGQTVYVSAIANGAPKNRYWDSETGGWKIVNPGLKSNVIAVVLP
jgi:hypothetical protein